MRRTGLAVAALSLLALTACGDDEPNASPTASPPTTAPPTSASPTTAPTSAAPTWPSGCDSPAALQPGTTVIEASVAGGKVTPPRKTYTVKLKSTVRLIVNADEPDEVHVHSYDKKVDTKPPCPAFLDLQATIPGTVEVELEDAGLHLFDIQAK